MPAFPVGKDHNAGSRLPDHASYFQTIFPGVLHATIRNIEPLPPLDLQNLCRLLCFSGALFGAAPRSHLSLSQIKDARSMTEFCHLEQCPSTCLFHVIAMGCDGQNIKFAHGFEFKYT